MVSKFSLIYIFISLLRYSRLKDLGGYFNVIKNLKKKGSKAVLLDKLLGDVFLNQWKKHKPDFSNLFLNTGAHFQHHYMFNSKAYSGDLKNPEWYCPENEDPLFEILNEYDTIIGRLLELDTRLVVATGLHQKPHRHNTFYWRLKNHDEFISNDLGLTKYKKITPRMSRDFLVEFENTDDAKFFQDKIETIYSKGDNIPVFTVDNRGESLFVELAYSNDIEDGFVITNGDDILVENLKSKVAFVAIKNGEHDGIGYLVDTNNKVNDKNKRIALKEVFNLLSNSFKA